jgi:glycosyltransferase involved in cell wall biosynthesis
MRIKNKKICFIIPAYNEEKTISKIIKKLKKRGTVIVVDDCSEDLTNKESINSGALVIRHSKNLGYDKSLQTGFKKAIILKFNFAITIDADGQHDLKNVEKFYKYLKQGFLIVYGKRNEKGRFMEKLFSIYFFFFYGVKDPLCGLKGYNLIFYKEFDLISSENFVGTKMLINARKKRLKIKEVPIIEMNRKDESRFGGSLLGNFKILTLFIKVISKDILNIFQKKAW